MQTTQTPLTRSAASLFASLRPLSPRVRITVKVRAGNSELQLYASVSSTDAITTTHGQSALDLGFSVCWSLSTAYSVNTAVSDLVSGVRVACIVCIL